MGGSLLHTHSDYLLLAAHRLTDAGAGEGEGSNRSLFIRVLVTHRRGGDGGMSEFLEIEQKFDVDTGFERPSFGGLAGVSAAAPVRPHLSAPYYDTADGRLAASKITLRRRTGGTDAGWHLKLPEGSGARREVHAPLGQAGEPVPEVLAARVAEVTG